MNLLIVSTEWRVNHYSIIGIYQALITAEIYVTMTNKATWEKDLIE